MVTIIALWMPIVLSAVLVFVVSSIVHMVLPYHRSDYDKFPDEDGVREALQKFDIPPGDYFVPHCVTGADAQKPEMKEKFESGPVGFFTVYAKGQMLMGKAMGQWFVYCLVVGILVAYLASRTLDAGAHYLEVFRIAGTAAFMAYGVANSSASIWKGQKWSTSFKHTFDALLYSLVTAGAFGWLWPSA